MCSEERRKKIGVALPFGSAMHKALERYYREFADGRIEKLSIMQELFEQILALELAEKQDLIVFGKTMPDKGSAIMMGRAMLGAYHLSIDLAGWKLVAAELPLSARDEEQPGSKGFNNPPGEIRDAPGGACDQKQAEAKCQVNVSQAAQQAKSMGNLPAGVAQLIEDILHPKLDWAVLLRNFVEQSARNDYCWLPPSRRYLSQGIYLPSLHSKELGRIVIAVDTSGSTSARVERWASDAVGTCLQSWSSRPTQEQPVQGFAAELTGFLQIYRSLPDPKLILLDPHGASVPTDPATLYAVCGALARLAEPSNMDALVTYANRLPDEFSVLLITDSEKQNLLIVSTPGPMPCGRPGITR
jgi:hypothetical protein